MITTIGTLGAALILIAFCFNRFKIWERDTVWYDLTNLCGGGLLVLYAFLIGSIPFAVLNIVWVGAVITAFVKKR